METLGYSASALIGISLGLIGGGGSILTVPVLVYLFGISPLLSTSYSLFIVGSTSLVGAFDNFRKGNVNTKATLLFSVSSITTVFLIRRFLIPVIPTDLFTLGDIKITESILTMVLFALLMIIAGIAMLKNAEEVENNPTNTKRIKLGKLLLLGTGIGATTGLLGAGGGFLLIPTLVLLVGLPMKEAVGTSLFIIALNSLIGFVSDLGHFTIDWLLLFRITGIAIAGIFIGGLINRKLNGNRLKKGFSWFIFAMGVYIIIKELFIT